MNYDILRHAMAWPKQYRNHYNTGPGCNSFADCEEMAKAGLMQRYTVIHIPGYIYSVTDAGKAKLRELDEELSK